MIQYPMSFDAKSITQEGIQTLWSTSCLSGELKMGIPKEFEGPGVGYSPEDFYCMALTNCFIATFKVFAEKSKIKFENLEAKGRLTLDRDEKGITWMKHFLLQVNLKGCPDKERGERLLQKVSQSCMVLNSVKTEKTFEFSLEN
ncbi:MAG: OsmC family protein [Bdellovibrionales bacterium]